MSKTPMPKIEMVVGADGTFGVVIEGRMWNAKIDRDTGRTEWISFPKGPRHAPLREACEQAATWLVGLMPRVAVEPDKASPYDPSVGWL